jgi:cytochrome P450
MHPYKLPADLFIVATIFRRPDVKWWPPFSLQHHDVLDLLSERDMARYRLQRRLIGRVYHPSNLHKYGPAIDEVLVRAIAKIKSLKGAEIDLKQWMHIIVVECLAAIVLSGPVGYLEDGTDHGAGKQAYLGWRRKSVMGLFRWANIAEMISPRLGRAFATIWGLNWRTPKTLKSFFPVSSQISPYPMPCNSSLTYSLL